MGGGAVISGVVGSWMKPDPGGDVRAHSAIESGRSQQDALSSKLAVLVTFGQTPPASDYTTTAAGNAEK